MIGGSFFVVFVVFVVDLLCLFVFFVLSEFGIATSTPVG
jgi:hypothetical protein